MEERAGMEAVQGAGAAWVVVRVAEMEVAEKEAGKVEVEKVEA